MSEIEEPSRSHTLNFGRCTMLSRSRRFAPPCRHQEGAFAVMFVAVLLVLWGFCGLALDTSRLYNRKAELQNVADAAALAAARKLNGTASGITSALAAASSAASSLNYQYNSTPISWSAAAIKFSTSPDRNGSWVDAGTAAAIASRVFYVKVDTSQLDSVGNVDLIFMPAVSSAIATPNINADAVAGRTQINVAPLAVCAMSPTPATPRINSASYVELVEYGFRRGVSYDLMNLNPGGTTPMNFVVNPLAPPGSSGSAADLLPSNVGPYVCTGTLSAPTKRLPPVAHPTNARHVVPICPSRGDGGVIFVVSELASRVGTEHGGAPASAVRARPAAADDRLRPGRVRASARCRCASRHSTGYA